MIEEPLADALVDDWYEQMKPAPRWVPTARADIPDGARVRETREGTWHVPIGNEPGVTGSLFTKPPHGTFEMWTEGTP